MNRLNAVLLLEVLFTSGALTGCGSSSNGGGGDGGGNGSSGPFTATGNMTVGRVGHTATLLSNGKVLMAGGVTTSSSSPFEASAELYDPAAGTFTVTGGMTGGGFRHTATLLPNGKVLVAGGNRTTYSSVASSAEVKLYDPVTGAFTVQGTMTTPRDSHTATLLPNGKVLMVAGVNCEPVPVGCSERGLSSAELYDPATGRSTLTGSMNSWVYHHTALLLPNGKVLIACGEANDVPQAELYDPPTGTFTLTGSMTDNRHRCTATLLPDGRVLLAGGVRGYSPVLASAELYDPATGVFTPTGSMTIARLFHTATLLPNGKVLVAGGSGDTSLASAELYDPATGTFTPTAGNMTPGLASHTATLLPNGKVLLAGGIKTKFTGSVASAELYTP